MTNMAAAASGVGTCRAAVPEPRGANRWARAEGEAGEAAGGVCAGAAARTWLLAAAELSFACHDCGEGLARGRGWGQERAGPGTRQTQRTDPGGTGMLSVLGVPGPVCGGP